MEWKQEDGWKEGKKMDGRKKEDGQNEGRRLTERRDEEERDG